MILAWLVAFQLSALQLQGSSTCPSPETVEKRLALLLPSESLADRRAELRREGAKLIIRVYEGEVLLGERRLAAKGTCAQLAGATAVILASWLSDLDAAQPPLPPPVTAPSDEPPPTASSARLRMAPTEPGGLYALTAWMGPCASLSTSGLSGGLMVGFSGARVEGGFGVSVSGAALGHHEGWLEGGVTSRAWERYAATAGPLYRWMLGSTSMDLQLDAALAALAIRDETATETLSRAYLDWGAAAGLRFAGASGLWVGARLYIWPQGPSRGATAGELVFSAGAGFGTP